MENTVYITGAGFSKAFSEKIPTIGDLSKDLIDNDLTEDYPHLSAFINNIKDSFIHLNSSFLEVLSNILLSNKLQFSIENISKFEIIKHEFLNYIHLSLIQYSVDVDKKELFKKFLFHVIDTKSQIITFNYDLMIDAFIETNLHQSAEYHIYTNDYVGESETLLNALTQEFSKSSKPHKKHGKLDILKLHGSLSWFKLPGNKNYDLNSIIKINNREKQNEFLLYNNPVFIPMAYSKDNYFDGSLFPFLWQKAYYWLNHCDNIVFIGYGFPETDLTNLNFFLQFKDKISDIVVIDDNNLKKLQAIFGEKVKPIGALNYVENL